MPTLYRKLALLAATALMFTNVAAQQQQEPYVEILDPRALELIDANATIKTHGTGYSWSEGPVWVKDGDFLLFSDVPENIIYKYSETEGVTEYLKPSGATGLSASDSDQGGNGLLINAKGELVIMQHGDRRVAIMDAPLDKPEAKFVSLAATYEGNRFNSPNDAIYRSNGDLYFTDPPYGLKEGRNDPNKTIKFDGVFRLKANGDIVVEDDSILFPNGIVLSTDEKRAYVAASDRNAATWYTFDVNKNGDLLNKQVFFDATALVGKEDEKGLPDGMVMHSDGYLFATGPGGVYIFTEKGEVLAKIRTGKATANCTFDADEKVLYMTAHDTLMSVKLK